MTEVTLTDSQRALILHRGSLFIEACPGAGKTHCIVERFIQRAQDGNRKGVALVSFTNAVVREARSRCARSPQLLQAPNFVGTIDSFINKFLFAPLHEARYEKPAIFRDTWETVHGTTFTVAQANTFVFQLAWFDYDPQLGASLQIHRAPSDQRHRLGGLNLYQRRAAEAKAAGLYDQFWNAGVFDAASARTLVRRFLENSADATLIGELVQSRFAEVIVDEIQDCSDSDVLMLEFLLDQGIPLVMVGDLEQAIYGFRGSNIEAILSLADRVHRGPRLNDNFRSSPVICKLINSIRHGSSEDCPQGDWPDDGPDVHVLTTSAFADLEQHIKKVAEAHTISPQDIVVLAHAEKLARKVAGARPAPTSSSSKLIQLARSAATVQDTSSSLRIRQRESQRFSVIIRGLAVSDLEGLADNEFFQAMSLRPRDYADGCLRLMYRADPYSMTPSDYRQELKLALQRLGWDQWINANALRAPSGNTWPGNNVTFRSELRWSTIHSFKGLQALAVAVAIPRSFGDSSSALSYWMRNEPDELRRVLYVGVSRAKKLLILVIHEDDCESVSGCLDRDGVAFKYVSS